MICYLPKTIAAENVILPVKPLAPAVLPEQLPAFFEKHKQLLEALDIQENFTVSTLKTTISFEERIERFRKINGTYQLTPSGVEHLSYYFFKAINETEKPKIWLIFCHGGKINSDVIGSSAYLPILEAFLKNVNIIGINHRGATSKEDMGCYSLEDRVNDIYVTLEHLRSTKQISEDDIVVGFGDSMGGHTISCALAEHELFDGVILTEPAAYTAKAQQLRIRELNDLFPEIPRQIPTFTETISNYAPIDAISVLAFKNFALKNKNVLLTYVQEDMKLQANGLFTPKLYVNTLSIKDNKKCVQNVVSYPGGHGDTTYLEINAIQKLLGSIRSNHEQ